MKARVFAKVNLSLNITGKKDGMHLLSGVYASVSLFDEVVLKKSESISVKFISRESSEIPVEKIPESNTAFKALKAVEELTGDTYSAVIKKGIPMAGGLGGSSADAAAVFAMAELIYSRDFSDAAIKTGSDVPFMMKGGFCLVEGLGENVNPLPFKALDLVIINCGDVSTAESYALFDALKKQENSAPVLTAEVLAFDRFENHMHNDLTVPSQILNPDILKTTAMIEEAGYRAHMTGSGGCVFVLSPDSKLERLLKEKGMSFYHASTVPEGVLITEN